MAVDSPLHHQVNTLFNNLLAEQTLQAPEGTRVSFGIADDDISGELQFVVETPEASTLQQQFQGLLNRQGQDHIIDSFIALDQHNAREQAELTLAAGEHLSKQEFALRYDGDSWQLDIRLHPVAIN